MSYCKTIGKTTREKLIVLLDSPGRDVLPSELSTYVQNRWEKENV